MLHLSQLIHSFIHEKRFDSLQSSIKFENGRYTVQLPWKTDSLMLPDNFLQSKQRLISLLKRLTQKPELLNEYNEIISTQEKEGIIETVKDPMVTVPGKTYYIPHREVVREERVTTKTRIVFDVCTRRKGPSLNKFLEAGPCLLPSF